jgi:hypothetical protein
LTGWQRKHITVTQAMDPLEFNSYHPLPPQWREFLATLTLQEREVQQLAADHFKSSYFMEKTHAFRKFVRERATPTKTN